MQATHVEFFVHQSIRIKGNTTALLYFSKTVLDSQRIHTGHCADQLESSQHNHLNHSSKLINKSSSRHTSQPIAT